MVLQNMCCDALGCRGEIEAELTRLQYENLALKRKLNEAETVIRHVRSCGIMAAKSMKQVAREYIYHDTGLKPAAPGEHHE